MFEVGQQLIRYVLIANSVEHLELEETGNSSFFWNSLSLSQYKYPNAKSVCALAAGDFWAKPDRSNILTVDPSKMAKYRLLKPS